MRTKSYSRRPKKRQIMWLIAVAAVVLLGFVVLRFMENRQASPEERGDANLRHAYDETTQITFQGEPYRQRSNLTTILLMGVDQFSAESVKNSHRNGGQADFLRLLVIDSVAQRVYQIAIDRDTITPITVLGVLGDRTGTRAERISLSHGFGKGGEDSCELTVEAMHNLLYGAPIDFYIAMNMDGIGELNDLLGGVTVTLEDDFSHIDPTMTQGKTLTLMGDQAEIFVRSRMSMSVGTNEARMQRQQQYLDAAQQLLTHKIQSDSAFMGTLYDSLSPYITTNLSRSRLINEAYAARNYQVIEPLTPQGEHSVDKEGYVRFDVDQEALKRLVVTVFFEKQK